MRPNNVIKIKIIKDGETIMEIPISEDIDECISKVRDELNELKSDFKDLKQIYLALADEVRLRMLIEFLNDKKKRFKDLLKEFNINPRMLTFNLWKMRRGGLIEKDKREYRVSPVALGSIAIAGIILNKVLRELRFGREWRRIEVE